MREIKYRGWDEELKKWHYGNYYFYTDTIYCVASDKYQVKNVHHCILFDGFCDWDLPRPHYKAFVNKNTVGQFTGLHDKNGVEIYEGDIIKNTIGKLEKVVFVNGSFQCASIEHPNANLYLLDTYTGYIEVIGNIHERSNNE